MRSLLMPGKLLPTLQVPKLKVGKRQNNDLLSCCDDFVMMIFHTVSVPSHLARNSSSGASPRQEGPFVRLVLQYICLTLMHVVQARQQGVLEGLCQCQAELQLKN